MALTLAHLAKVEQDAFKKYIIQNLLREVKLMEYLPFENVNALKSIAVRWQTLPSVAFRAINAGYTPSEGDLEQVWESVYALGGEIKFDRVFDKIGNTIVDPVRTQTDMKILSLALTFNNYFINGDHATDILGFEGLKKRISNMPSRQKVGFAGDSATAHDPTASVAAARSFFDNLEKIHVRTNKGEVNVIFGNEGFYWGVGVVARYANIAGGNWLSVTKDSFDRDITTYKGAPLVDVGMKKDQTTEIITNTEVAGDSGNDSTSIYSCSFNAQQGITGIQLPPGLEVYDPLGGGEQESTPTKLKRFEWWLGLAGFGSYGFVRGWNLLDPAAWT